MVGSRVYVGGLPFGVRDRDLEKFFKGFGRIRDILIKNGYGFVVSFSQEACLFWFSIRKANLRSVSWIISLKATTHTQLFLQYIGS